MDTGTHNIRHIFGRDQRLIVPLFQRPYVWRRDAQWEPLWDDIRKVAERLLAKQPVRPHFLGAIVLDQLRQPVGRVDGRLIIDGQQRLTTIQLFLEAFADACLILGTENYHKALVKLTRNDDPMSEDIEEIYKIWPTNIDQEHFRRVMDAGSPPELLQSYKVKSTAVEVGHPIADCYLYFYSEITNWIASENDGLESRLDSLYNTLRDYMRMVVIDLDKDDDAQLIFETLNARGTPLLPSDLIKNFLFHKADNEKEKIDPLYNKYWKTFDEESKYWRAEIGIGHAKRARIDLFLQYYLTLKTGDEVPVSHVYNSFREYVLADKKTSASQHLAEIRKYADLYQSFSKFSLDPRVGLFFYRLDIMGVMTAYPFLLELFARYSEDNPSTVKILTDIESYLVRRMVCQLSARGYNKTFIDLLSVFTNEDGAIVDKVQARLKEFEAESNRWPRDGEFKQAWLDRPIYNLLRRQRVRMILEALEYQVSTGFTEPIQIRTNLTIEHLMPQEWSKHWPLPDDDQSEEAEMNRNRLLHTMGNLTLLTKKLNPSISNNHWEAKKDAIQEHSRLILNRRLKDIQEWSENSILMRGQTLYDHARNIWLSPDE